MGFAEKARRAHGTVVDLFPELWRRDLDHGANERPWGVVLPAVAPGVAHVLDLGFIQVRELVLLGLGPIGVIQRGGAARFLAEHIVDVLEGLLEYGTGTVLQRKRPRQRKRTS